MLREIRALTGLRGAATLIVLAYHFLQLDRYDSDDVPWLILMGYLWLDLLFLLSGFLMAFSDSRLFTRSAPKEEYRRYVVRRLARVYPVYVAALLFFLIAYKLSPGVYVEAGYGFLDFAAGLFMVQGWLGGFSTLDPSSSAVSALVVAFLLFPYLVPLTVSAKDRIAIATGLVLICSLCALSWFCRGDYQNLELSSGFWRVCPLLRCITDFGLGLMTYRMAQHPLVRRAFSSPAALVLVLGGLVVADLTHSPDLLVYVFFPLIVIALYFDTILVKALFSNRVTHHFGVISYPLFLIHPFFVGLKAHADQLEPTAEGRMVVFAVFLVLTYGAALLLHKVIQQPGERFILSRLRGADRARSR